MLRSWMASRDVQKALCHLPGASGQEATHLLAQFYVYVDISCVVSMNYIKTRGT
jgi:hypothetical protein